MKTFTITGYRTQDSSVRERGAAVRGRENVNAASSRLNPAALQRYKAKLLAERLTQNKVARTPVFSRNVITVPPVSYKTSSAGVFVPPFAPTPGAKSIVEPPVKVREAMGHVRPEVRALQGGISVRTKGGSAEQAAALGAMTPSLPYGWKRNAAHYTTPTGRNIPIAALNEPDAFFSRIRTKENPSAGRGETPLFRSLTPDSSPLSAVRVRTKPEHRILRRISGTATGAVINSALTTLRAATQQEEEQQSKPVLSRETAEALGIAVISAAGKSAKGIYHITAGAIKHTFGIVDRVPRNEARPPSVMPIRTADTQQSISTPSLPTVRVAPQTFQQSSTPQTQMRTASQLPRTVQKAQKQAAVPLVKAPESASERAAASATLPVRTKEQRQTPDSVRVKKDPDASFIRTKENSAKSDAPANSGTSSDRLKTREPNDRTKTRESKDKDSSKDSKSSGGPKALAVLRTISKVQNAIKSVDGAVSGEDNDVAKLLALPFKALGRKALMYALPAIAGFLAQLLPPFLLFMAIFASPLGVFFAAEDVSPDTVSIPSVFAQCNYEAGQIANGWVDWVTTQAKADYGEDTTVNVILTGSFADPASVLAVWAVKTAAASDTTATDVLQITREKADGLTQVFWDMNSLRYTQNTNLSTSEGEDSEPVITATVTLTIISSHKDWTEMPDFYGFSDSQREILYELMTEFYDMLKEAAGNLQLSSVEAIEVIKNLPSDLSPERRAIISHGLTLVGKVTYFWGGKSFAFGWDDSWGKLMLVTAADDETTGTYRAYGLDCSGFVGWAYINGFGDKGVFSQLGYTSKVQYSLCTPVSYYEAEIGDLAFYRNSDDVISHVGIICGRNSSDTDWLVLHCDGASGVTISEFTRYGFWSIARPNLFKDYGEIF